MINKIKCFLFGHKFDWDEYDKRMELEEQMVRWDNSGVSASLASWHCGMGHIDNKSRYQQALEELEYLIALEEK